LSTKRTRIDRPAWMTITPAATKAFEKITAFRMRATLADLQKSQTAVIGRRDWFCPLQAMFSLGFLVLCQTVYQVIGWCNAIDAVDKSDWPALPCPLDVRVPAANLVEKYHSRTAATAAKSRAEIGWKCTPI
jgi:hypothetical protein